MNAILLPEVVIYNALDSIVKMLRKDIKDNEADETESILYRILGVDCDGVPIIMNRVNFYKQAKALIMKVDNLKIYIGYNLEASKMICMHILLPSEQGKTEIGNGEGYQEDLEYNAEEELISTQQYVNQTFDSNYQIMITSDNSQEVMLWYHVLKSLFLLILDHLELKGLRNMRLSGGDIMFQDDIVPVTINHKVLNLSFTYDHTVAKMLKEKVAKNFYTIFRMIDYEGKSSSTTSIVHN